MADLLAKVFTVCAEHPEQNQYGCAVCGEIKDLQTQLHKARDQRDKAVARLEHLLSTKKAVITGVK